MKLGFSLDLASLCHFWWCVRSSKLLSYAECASADGRVLFVCLILNFMASTWDLVQTTVSQCVWVCVCVNQYITSHYSPPPSLSPPNCCTDFFEDSSVSSEGIFLHFCRNFDFVLLWPIANRIKANRKCFPFAIDFSCIETLRWYGYNFCTLFHLFQCPEEDDLCTHTHTPTHKAYYIFCVYMCV